jgi:hypothetical protein
MLMGYGDTKQKRHHLMLGKGRKGISPILQDALYLEGQNPHGIDGILGSGTEIAVKGISKGQGNTFRRYCR